VPQNEESLRASARDLADTRHAHRSLRASLERRVRARRRRRAATGGRRALVAATCLLAAGAAGAAAQESAERSSSSTRSASATAAGYDVRAVQRKLGVTADGVFGPQTRRALKRFQRRHGLSADGIVGPQTLRALGLTAKPRAAGGDTSTLQRIAECESGGDPTAVSPDGRYRGKYQFSRSTWRSLGGSGDPAAAPEAEQDERAALLMQRQGPSAWPTCSKRV
jgi:Transglycosylase-like domain/Putative peptidoglycan binding domain